MKSIFIPISALTLMLCSCAGESVKYSGFTIDGIGYSIIENTKKVEVSRINEMVNEKGIITIPRNVNFGNSDYTVIGIRKVAFFDCTSLTDLYLPESLEYIGNAAFSGCNIKYIYCNAVEPPTIEEKTFDDVTYNTATLYVPSLSKYKQEKGWIYFKNIKEIE